MTSVLIRKKIEQNRKNRRRQEINTYFMSIRIAIIQIQQRNRQYLQIDFDKQQTYDEIQITNEEMSIKQKQMQVQELMILEEQQFLLKISEELEYGNSLKRNAAFNSVKQLFKKYFNLKPLQRFSQQKQTLTLIEKDYQYNQCIALWIYIQITKETSILCSMFKNSWQEEFQNLVWILKNFKCHIFVFQIVLQLFSLSSKHILDQMQLKITNQFIDQLFEKGTMDILEDNEQLEEYQQLLIKVIEGLDEETMKMVLQRYNFFLICLQHQRNQLCKCLLSKISCLSSQFEVVHRHYKQFYEQSMSKEKEFVEIYEEMQNE